MKFFYDKIMHEDDGEHWADFGDDYLQPYAVYVDDEKLAKFMKDEYQIDDYKKFFTEEYVDDDIRDMESDLRQMGAKFVPDGKPFQWL